jgi:hypothetical protein
VVSRVVLLDAGPLGLVTNPQRSRQSVACAQWLQALVTHGLRVIVPEIADYERLADRHESYTGGIGMQHHESPHELC